MVSAAAGAKQRAQNKLAWRKFNAATAAAAAWASGAAQDSSTANRSPARDHPPAARRRLAKRLLPSLS